MNATTTTPEFKAAQPLADKGSAMTALERDAMARAAQARRAAAKKPELKLVKIEKNDFGHTVSRTPICNRCATFFNSSAQTLREQRLVVICLANEPVGTFCATCPAIGMGATLCMYTDRHAYTVTRVSASGNTFWMTQDTAVRTDNNGMSDQQEYAYTSNPDSPAVAVRMTKRGWKANGTPVVLGHRRSYHDFSF